MAEPNSTSERPKVYVCVTGGFGPRDVSGCLLLETGEAPWGHVSSSVGFLKSDLTTGFKDRRERLEQLYPDGYDVVVIDVDDDLPPEVREANERWYAGREDASDERT